MAKEMGKGRSLGTKCILMLYREGKTWRDASGEAGGGKKKIQNGKSGRSWF